ncbi:ComF family protein [Syntrophomonas zehnderi]|nr:ComF family protein [Syntrophomonas zehnderi]
MLKNPLALKNDQVKCLALEVAMIDVLLDFLFPQEVCCICRKPGKYNTRRPWCKECQEKMLQMQCSCPTCDKCGKYLENGASLCADCQKTPPGFELARSVGPYNEPYRIAIKVLKFMGRKHLAYCMGDMMAEKVQSEPRFMPIDLIVPVPISSGGLKQRGFNQAELLARQVSKRLKVKMDPRIIYRVKDTPSQVELSREEREKNLQFAFQIEDNRKVYRKNILLVDDVYTTGSTSRECTRVLLEAGAARVCIITWATGKGY